MRKDKISLAVKAPTTRKVHQSSKFSQVWHVDSVRTGEPYQVRLVWSKPNGIATLTGQLITFDQQPHPANSSRYVCYQVLAAARRMASETERILSLCRDEAAAKRLLRLGGELVKVVNPAGATIWAVVR